jgi:hypothetical protein
VRAFLLPVVVTLLVPAAMSMVSTTAHAAEPEPP